ncbi:MAG: hypothetical protein B7733_09695 [Myxococcales bacterium FL481]|nr:MAG: hypothetical protein B7733_09695 [Myxococcales bacterium FL481]
MSQEHPDHTVVTQLLPPLDREWVTTDAANDAPLPGTDASWVHDVNRLVSGVVHQLSRRLIEHRVLLELDLCPGAPSVSGDPQQLAFVLEGILAAEMESVADVERGVIRIKTSVSPDAVKISVLGNSLPLLRFIRAVAEDESGLGDMDPTVAHCRRVLEELGGWIELRDERGFVGFELNIPALPLCNPTSVVPFRLHSTRARSFEPALCMAG